MSDERRPPERLPGPLPEPLLERLALGELPDAAARRRGADPETAARLAALAEADRAFLAAHPPEVVVPAIRRRLAESAAPRRRPGRLWLVPVAAAAVLAVWGVRPGAPVAPAPEGPALEGPALGGVAADGIRFKGDARLLAHRRGPGGVVESLAPGAVVAAGDRLQLSYVAAGAAHGAVVSIDGRGAVTLHFPLTPRGSTALAPDGPRTLPRSYELDDAPAFERFVLVTADAPVPVDAVVDAARAVAGTPEAARAALSLPPGLKQTDFLVYKADVTGPESSP